MTLSRYSSLKRGSKGLRTGRSTGQATKLEALHIDTIKRGECICCVLNRDRGLATAFFGGCDAHHTLSGGRRIGHMATLGLCAWHHRGVKPMDGMSDKQATETFGPSLAHGSKPFHAMYGSDSDLLAMQAEAA